MASNHADAAIAIPWFNNIWFGSVPAASASPSTDISNAPATTTTTAITTNSAARDVVSTTSPSVQQHAQHVPTVTSTTSQMGDREQDESLMHLRTATSTASAARTRSVASSHLTISTLSAMDRISLISLLSTKHASASDILRTLSDPDLLAFAPPTPTPPSTSVSRRSAVRLYSHQTPFRSAPHIHAQSSSASVTLSPSTVDRDRYVSATSQHPTTARNVVSVRSTNISTMRRASSTPPFAALQYGSSSTALYNQPNSLTDRA